MTTVNARLRSRDLNGKGNGTQELRLVCDLQRGTARYADKVAERVTGQWPRMSILASARGCEQRGELPVGSVLINITFKVKNLHLQPSPEYSVGIVQEGADGRAKIIWNDENVDHLKVERLGDTWAHTIKVDDVRYTLRTR